MDLIREAFSGTDWSQFWPNMIVGLFTGIVVGVVLRIGQNRRRRRVARREAKITVGHYWDGPEQMLSTGIQFVDGGLVPTQDLRKVTREVVSAGDVLSAREAKAHPEIDFIGVLDQCLEVLANHGRALEIQAKLALRRTHTSDTHLVESDFGRFVESLQGNLDGDLAWVHGMDGRSVKALDGFDEEVASLLIQYRNRYRTAKLAMNGYLEYKAGARGEQWFKSVREAAAKVHAPEALSRSERKRLAQEGEVSLKKLFMDRWMAMQDTFGP